MMQSRIDGEVLRHVMRQVPSAVTVVTVSGAGEIRGITIGSFTSTSLRPPLISFNLSRDATTYDALVMADHFAVHLLSTKQAHLAEHFATPDLTSDEQFEAVPYQVDADGTPILLDALVVIRCERFAIYDAGDHSIVVGRVSGLDRISEGEPLLYYDRTYRGVGREVQPATFEPAAGDERPGRGAA